METILVVDDAPDIRKTVGFVLNEDESKYQIIEAGDGQEAIDRFQEGGIDLVLLDIGMPEMDGKEACRKIREISSSVPIIFLTAKKDQFNEALCIELGGDDFIRNPFDNHVFRARVGAALRRSKQSEEPSTELESVASEVITHGELRLNNVSKKVWCGNLEIQLTPVEFGVLKTLMSRPEKVFSHDEIMGRAYPDPNHVVDPTTINAHVSGINKKFGELGCARPIKTKHGFGFQLKKN